MGDADMAATRSEALDFCSSKFDPLKALYTPGLQPPIPNIQIFNNVAEYARVIQNGQAKASPKEPTAEFTKLLPSRTRNLKPEEKKKAEARINAVQEKLKFMAEKGLIRSDTDLADIRRSRKFDELKKKAAELIREDEGKQARNKRVNVFDKMEACQNGPFSVLHTCVKERHRIKVWTRTFKGLRSVLAGYLVAFDKHMNMALTDVDEVYTTEERAPKDEKAKEKAKRKKKRWKEKTRMNKENANPVNPDSPSKSMSHSGETHTDVVGRIEPKEDGEGWARSHDQNVDVVKQNDGIPCENGVIRNALSDEKPNHGNEHHAAGVGCIDPNEVGKDATGESDVRHNRAEERSTDAAPECPIRSIQQLADCANLFVADNAAAVCDSVQECNVETVDVLERVAGEPVLARKDPIYLGQVDKISNETSLSNRNTGVQTFKAVRRKERGASADFLGERKEASTTTEDENREAAESCVTQKMGDPREHGEKSPTGDGEFVVVDRRVSEEEGGRRAKLISSERVAEGEGEGEGMEGIQFTNVNPHRNVTGENEGRREEDEVSDVTASDKVTEREDKKTKEDEVMNVDRSGSSDDEGERNTRDEFTSVSVEEVGVRGEKRNADLDLTGRGGEKEKETRKENGFAHVDPGENAKEEEIRLEEELKNADPTEILEETTNRRVCEDEITNTPCLESSKERVASSAGAIADVASSEKEEGELSSSEDEASRAKAPTSNEGETGSLAELTSSNRKEKETVQGQNKPGTKIQPQDEKEEGELSSSESDEGVACASGGTTDGNQAKKPGKTPAADLRAVINKREGSRRRRRHELHAREEGAQSQSRSKHQLSQNQRKEEDGGRGKAISVGRVSSRVGDRERFADTHLKARKNREPEAAGQLGGRDRKSYSKTEKNAGSAKFKRQSGARSRDESRSGPSQVESSASSRGDGDSRHPSVYKRDHASHPGNDKRSRSHEAPLTESTYALSEESEETGSAKSEGKVRARDVRTTREHGSRTDHRPSEKRDKANELDRIRATRAGGPRKRVGSTGGQVSGICRETATTNDRISEPDNTGPRAERGCGSDGDVRGKACRSREQVHRSDSEASKTRDKARTTREQAYRSGEESSITRIKGSAAREQKRGLGSKTREEASTTRGQKCGSDGELNKTREKARTLREQTWGSDGELSKAREKARTAREQKRGSDGEANKTRVKARTVREQTCGSDGELSKAREQKRGSDGEANKTRVKARTVREQTCGSDGELSKTRDKALNSREQVRRTDNKAKEARRLAREQASRSDSETCKMRSQAKETPDQGRTHIKLSKPDVETDTHAHDTGVHAYKGTKPGGNVSVTQEQVSRSEGEAPKTCDKANDVSETACSSDGDVRGKQSHKAHHHTQSGGNVNRAGVRTNQTCDLTAGRSATGELDKVSRAHGKARVHGTSGIRVAYRMDSSEEENKAKREVTGMPSYGMKRTKRVAQASPVETRLTKRPRICTEERKEAKKNAQLCKVSRVGRTEPQGEHTAIKKRFEQKATLGCHSVSGAYKVVMTGRGRCLVYNRRHVNQLFIRGENVVMVAYSK